MSKGGDVAKAIAAAPTRELGSPSLGSRGAARGFHWGMHLPPDPAARRAVRTRCAHAGRDPLGPRHQNDGRMTSSALRTPWHLRYETVKSSKAES